MFAVIPSRGCRGFLLPLLLLLFGPAQPANAEVHTIMVGDNFFSNPQGIGAGDLVIQVGDTVRWVNGPGGNPHDVTSDTNAWAPSPTASSWPDFEVTFNEVGEFDYRCTVHPFSMRGTITVQDSTEQAELELQSLGVEGGRFFAGELLSLAYSILNSGAAASGSYTITYYASEDSDITAADHVLGSELLGDLAAGATLDRQASVAVPENIPAGVYFIGAILTFADGNAANNTAFDATAVTLLGIFLINAGLNDAWLDFGTIGQGVFFVVYPDQALFFLAWFTYDIVRPDGSVVAIFGEPGHRWVSAIGNFEPGATVTLDVTLTQGGVFAAPFPPAENILEYGTITITFVNCNLAILEYDFPALMLSGTITLTRITADNAALCEALIAELQEAP